MKSPPRDTNPLTNPTHPFYSHLRVRWGLTPIRSPQLFLFIVTGTWTACLCYVPGSPILKKGPKPAAEMSGNDRQNHFPRPHPCSLGVSAPTLPPVSPGHPSSALKPCALKPCALKEDATLFPSWLKAEMRPMGCPSDTKCGNKKIRTLSRDPIQSWPIAAPVVVPVQQNTTVTSREHNGYTIDIPSVATSYSKRFTSKSRNCGPGAAPPNRPDCPLPVYLVAAISTRG